MCNYVAELTSKIFDSTESDPYCFSNQIWTTSFLTILVSSGSAGNYPWAPGVSNNADYNAGETEALKINVLLISFPVSRLDYSINHINESSNLIPFVSCLQDFLSLIFTIYPIFSAVKLPKDGKNAQSFWARNLQGQREEQGGLVMKLTMNSPEKNISSPPLSFSCLISPHLSIHWTKMLFRSKKARNSHSSKYNFP